MLLTGLCPYLFEGHRDHGLMRFCANVENGLYGSSSLSYRHKLLSRSYRTIEDCNRPFLFFLILVYVIRTEY
jgi:hypothetical protein